MKLSARLCLRLAFLIACAVWTAVPAAAQAVLDTGALTMTGRVSGYVEIRAGGAATLLNSSGGGITNNKSKGAGLDNPTQMTIDFGEVGPSNAASFIIASVPIRLRSNVAYTLKLSAAPMTYGGGAPDGSSVTLADIGFGVTAAVRDSGGGVAGGSDTIAATANGDPTSAARGGIDPATGRYQYNAGFALSDYTAGATIVSGPRIMNAMVPTANGNGLVVTTTFVIKPQFFTPGSFSTSVTFTVSNP